MELACAIAGGLYRVDPFDQPGVEDSKRLTYALMGRAGFEELAERVTQEDRGEERFRF
jgi:glucose-6-phosphate isomerase